VEAGAVTAVPGTTIPSADAGAAVEMQGLQLKDAGAAVVSC
jgi:hypothetical protein